MAAGAEAARAGTIAEALGAASEALRAAGVESPRLDAELLLVEATGRDRASLLARSGEGVEPVAARRFGGLVRRRLRREPIAYILGRRGFRRLELELDARVLIPRPETELLVEVALELAPERILDVGTGSGAVALAIADELPWAAVVATDLSPGALTVAQANADRLGLAARVHFARGSLPDPGAFGLVVANLPYVSEAEYRLLAPEIVDYEPRGALVAGPTGLEAIEALLAELALGSIETDAVALEIGAGQSGIVAELIRRAGFDRIAVRCDLAGIERVVVGRR